MRTTYLRLRGRRDACPSIRAASAFRGGAVPLLLILAIGAAAQLRDRAAGAAESLPAAAFGPITPRLTERGDATALSYQGAIWRMPVAGGRLTRLTSGSGFDVEPAWSPDGRRIAYIESRDFNRGTLRLIRSDDGSPVKLPRDATVNGKLHFDRSGREVLGNFQLPGGETALAWYDLESGELRAVAIEAAQAEPASDPFRRRPNTAVSRDGQWIALVTTLDLPGQQGGNNGPQNDLWKVPARGGRPQRITRFPARIHDLCWSADGRSLIVATEVGGVHNDLWEVPVTDPAGARQLTFGQADEDRPSVSADGRRLLFLDNRHGPTALVARDLDSGEDRIPAPRSFDYGKPTGGIEIQVRDGTGPVTARLALQHADGKFHAPPGALYRLLAGDLHFYAHDRAALDVPAGRYVVKAWRGPEYRPVRRELTVEPGGRAQVTLDLQRWTEPREWVSGESHIHANYGYGHWYNSPATMRLQCSGEDLTIANLVVANSDGDGVFDREFFRGEPDPLSTERAVLYWNEEFRSTIWGHMTLLNLKQLVTPIYTGFRGTTHPHDWPTNGDIADLTHDQDGLATYTHPANNVRDPYLSPYSAKGMPLDVALGKIDSIDVMGTGHEANLPVWYRLLNCGLRVPASAGTDVFLNRINSRLPGSDRVYVHCPGPLDYRRWIDNLKAGRTFVTNGPMLELTAGGLALGETLRRERPGPVQVRGRALAQYPLDRIEILVNGRVAATAAAVGERREVTFDQPVTIESSGWIALRAIGPRPDPALAPGSRAELFAHTSPVYVEVPGRPVQAREDAEYFLAWLDRLWTDVRERDRIPSSRRAHVEAQIAAGKAFYRQLASRGP